jgi:hypothetical protein
MAFSNQFQAFIKDSISPYSDKSVAVDPYSYFEIHFEDVSCAFASSPSEVVDKDLYKILKKDFHQFVKNVNGVEVSVNSKSIDLPGSSYAIHRLMPMNNPNNITLNMLNTKLPFIEAVFVPWMKANTIENRPLPLVKTNMAITFPRLIKPIVYWYYGVRPIECGLHKMSNEPNSEFYRKVTLDFDYFWINDSAAAVPTKTTNQEPTQQEPAPAETT